jgi:hypothetical protein
MRIWDGNRLLMGYANSDTGEHIENDKHELEYIPFPTCDETGRPLELKYGIEEGIDILLPWDVPAIVTSP